MERQVEMNTVHQGLKEWALSNFKDENDQLDNYNNYAIDYLNERIESIIIDLSTLDEKEEFVRQIEKALDEFEGVY